MFLMLRTIAFVSITAFLLQASTGPDVCYYTLRIPADMDVPSTAHYDTTLVRSKTCAKHILKLGSWGTSSSYVLSADTALHVKAISLSIKARETGSMDITQLPAGTYTLSLMACGNGGACTVRIK